MCRIYGFRATEETKVECSLVHAQNALMLQSRADVSGRSHSDGWGIAFYHNSHPEIERRATAAFEDLHFSETAERIFTTAVLAHVRLATVGEPSLLNSHPFSAGCWAFVHNGTVRGFERLRDRLESEMEPELRERIQGVTDSEHAFYWLLSRMARAGIAWTEPCRAVDELSRLVGESVAELAARCSEVETEKPPRLNFLLTDGEILIATRWENSLYWLEREGIHDCEICGIPHVHHRPNVEYRAVVVASEPITHEDWREVPDFSVLSVDRACHCRLQAIPISPLPDTALTLVGENQSRC